MPIPLKKNIRKWNQPARRRHSTRLSRRGVKLYCPDRGVKLSKCSSAGFAGKQSPSATKSDQSPRWAGLGDGNRGGAHDDTGLRYDSLEDSCLYPAGFPPPEIEILWRDSVSRIEFTAHYGSSNHSIAIGKAYQRQPVKASEFASNGIRDFFQRGLKPDSEPVPASAAGTGSRLNTTPIPCGSVSITCSHVPFLRS